MGSPPATHRPRAWTKQDYGTPRALIDAVERRWGPLGIDLAAREDNAKAPVWIDPEIDSLRVPWRLEGRTAWLNPPFYNLAPWAAKCEAWRRMIYLAHCEGRAPDDGRILLLVPASVGSTWFYQHVHAEADVHALHGRLTFEGCDQPYPKDCIIAEYAIDAVPGFDVWDWRNG